MKKYIITVMVILLLLSSGFVGVSLPKEESHDDAKIMENIDRQRKEIQTSFITNGTIETPSHEYKYPSTALMIDSGYTHTIKEIAAPYVIGGKNGEWFYFVVLGQTSGSGWLGRRVYIQVWCEGELFYDWASSYLVRAGIEGRNTYPFKIQKEIEETTLDFMVKTGHIEWGKRIEDDQQNFSVLVGKSGTAIDQTCTIILSGYYEMTTKLSPFFQEITVGKRGQLQSIDLKPPLSIPGADPWGCGSECELNVLIIEWFDNWTKIPWNKEVFSEYLLGEETISWPCSYFPEPEWREVNFSNHNISFNRDQKFIMMLEGNVFTCNCGNQGAECLGFSGGPAGCYPNERGRVGFWDGFNDIWQTWPTGDWDLNFRTWVRIPDDNNPPDKPSTPNGSDLGVLGSEFTYKCSTTDPNGDDIHYLFDWGDGSDTGWLGPYSSGEEVTINHTWANKGLFDIRVRSKDFYDVVSDWSDPFEVNVEAPVIKINDVKGGFLQITAVIKNIGEFEAKNLECIITLDNGFIFVGFALFDRRTRSDDINLSPGEEISLNSKLIFGYGNIKVTVIIKILNETLDVKEMDARIFSFFIFLSA